MANYSKDSYVATKEIYPIVSKSLATNNNKFKLNMQKYFNTRHNLIFAIAPYDRIYFNQTDVDDLFNSLKLDESSIKKIMENMYYWNLPINPTCAKEPYVVLLLMCIRYYIKKNDEKSALITSVYLAFSGKIYASLHGYIFKKFPPSEYKEVMDFVINNVLTDKFDIKAKGTLFGAVESICKSWVKYATKYMKSDDFSDTDLKDVLQQLRDRIKAFLINIADPYFKAYENRNYLNYENEDFSDENFRLTENDSATAARLTEKTLNYMTANYVSLEICNKCRNSSVSANNIKSIMETILADNDNLPDLRYVISVYIGDFLRAYPGGDIGSVTFVSYSFKGKPNSKDKYVLKCKEKLLKFLDENSPTYRKIKTRNTRTDYYKSISLYIILLINKMARSK